LPKGRTVAGKRKAGREKSEKHKERGNLARVGKYRLKNWAVVEGKGCRGAKTSGGKRCGKWRAVVEILQSRFRKNLFSVREN